MIRRGREEAAGRWVRSVLDSESDAAVKAAPEKRPEAGDPVAAGAAEIGWPAVWADLELPPSPGVPLGFARRVARAGAAERERATAPILGAVWMRAAAAAALLVGIALGSGLSASVGTVESSPPVEDSWATTSLSEEYLVALQAPEAVLEADENSAAADEARAGLQKASEP